ncbi:hypothetical protein CEXT_12731 [Caerostris extrusa]|uniref:Uncharacterized protein n=1 Tax=Caerostris extrusa TaxID=172846 RepID=A0AAV4Y6P7_CAEEX|nr:hypothetical protein CEXT_12731 [Caerostris extrusa]
MLQDENTEITLQFSFKKTWIKRGLSYVLMKRYSAKHQLHFPVDECNPIHVIMSGGAERMTHCIALASTNASISVEQLSKET